MQDIAVGIVCRNIQSKSSGKCIPPPRWLKFIPRLRKLPLNLFKGDFEPRDAYQKHPQLQVGVTNRTMLKGSENKRSLGWTRNFQKLIRLGSSRILDLVLGVRFLGSRSRGFAVKIFIYLFF